MDDVNFVINPKTGRKIKKGGPTHKKLTSKAPKGEYNSKRYAYVQQYDMFLSVKTPLFKNLCKTYEYDKENNRLLKPGNVKESANVDARVWNDLYYIGSDHDIWALIIKFAHPCCVLSLTKVNKATRKLVYKVYPLERFVMYYANRKCREHQRQKILSYSFSSMINRKIAPQEDRLGVFNDQFRTMLEKDHIWKVMPEEVKFACVLIMHKRLIICRGHILKFARAQAEQGKLSKYSFNRLLCEFYICKTMIEYIDCMCGDDENCYNKCFQFGSNSNPNIIDLSQGISANGEPVVLDIDTEIPDVYLRLPHMMEERVVTKYFPNILKQSTSRKFYYD
jgi:hypothetical protein